MVVKAAIDGGAAMLPCASWGGVAPTGQKSVARQLTR
jgi:hypothetical protein